MDKIKSLLNSKWFVYLLLFSLFSPVYFDSYVLLDRAIAFLKLLACIVIAFIYVLRIKTHMRKQFNTVFLCLWIELLISTLLHLNEGTSAYACFFQFMSIAPGCFLAEELLLDAPRNGIECMYGYFSFWVLANTMTVYLFPQALYADAGGWRCWLLGDDNTAYAFYILASTLALVYSRCLIKRTTLISFCVWACSFIYVFQRDIATGIMCQLLWLLLFIIYHSKWLRKMLNANYALYITVGGFILIVLLRRLILESVVTALGRSMTLSGRTPIWDAVLGSVKGKYLLLGHGVYTGDGFNLVLAQRARGTHNYFLNLLFWGGIAGVVLFSLLILYACRHRKELRKTDFYRCITIGLIICAARFLVENGRNEFFYILLAMLSYTNEFTEKTSTVRKKGIRVRLLPYKITSGKRGLLNE